MSPLKPFDAENLALYALRALSPEELAEVRTSLHSSPEAREALAEMYGGLSILAYTAEMHEPPAGARERLMRQVAEEKRPLVVTPTVTRDEASAGGGRARDGGQDGRWGRGVEDLRGEKAGWDRGIGRALPWMGWALAAGLLIGVGGVRHERKQLEQALAQDEVDLARSRSQAELAKTLLETVRDPRAVQVMLTSTGQQPKPEGRASYVASKGSLVFLASNLAPLEARKTYELWVIPADGSRPMAAGTFQPDARGFASLLLPKMPQGVTAKAFGVTIEAVGGSETPTLPIVLQGTAG